MINLVIVEHFFQNEKLFTAKNTLAFYFQILMFIWLWSLLYFFLIILFFSPNLAEYSKDLPTYLQYCKDVVFAGVEPLYKDPTFIEELWDFYEKNREVMYIDFRSLAA